jgi:hypothetical protein
MNTSSRLALVAALSAVLSACASTSSAPVSPQSQFFERISALCGQAFEGRVATDTPAPTGDDPFAAGPLVMHVRDCSEREIRIPFHVGEDRSRTWVLTRTGAGLRLKHDHRHEDGSEDVLTQYGGDTASAGTAARQEFPVDAESQALFTREGRTVSNTNVWAMEIEPGRVFVYELGRPQRLFRVEFDLNRPVTPPPAPWGAND